MVEVSPTVEAPHRDPLLNAVDWMALAAREEEAERIKKFASSADLERMNQRGRRLRFGYFTVFTCTHVLYLLLWGHAVRVTLASDIAYILLSINSSLIYDLVI